MKFMKILPHEKYDLTCVLQYLITNAVDKIIRQNVPKSYKIFYWGGVDHAQTTPFFRSFSRWPTQVKSFERVLTTPMPHPLT